MRYKFARVILFVQKSLSLIARILLHRIGDWTVDSGVDYAQVMQGATYIVDHMLEDNEIQKHGSRIILDYKGLHLSWILQFLPPHRIPVSSDQIRFCAEFQRDEFSIVSVIRYAGAVTNDSDCLQSVLSNLQEGCPLKIRAIHIVNQPVSYNVAFALASPFISKKVGYKVSEEFSLPEVGLEKFSQGTQCSLLV